ncbi:MAG: hypothetical protein K2N72_02945 [Oscillospiraceae bacterium]|nr:hypothetical protein [Oscillospiraceae bacterium]
MNKFKIISAMILSAAMVFSITACANSAEAANSDIVIPDKDGWFAAWTSAQMITGSSDPVINPHLVENTVRQQIRPSIGGDKIRLTLSNEYDKVALRLEAVHIAHLVEAGNNAIDTSTDTVITFGGSENVEIPVGETIVSDEIDFSFEAFQDLAVTIKVGKLAGITTTGHNDALSYVWIGEGNHVSDETFTAAMTTVNWYFLSELDVWAEAGTKTLVVVGDSITDCYGARDNQYERWSDVLSRQLRSNQKTADISVVNEGIGGNAIFGGAGTALKDRFDRDVLNVAGVKYVIVLIGINDIGGADKDISENMIGEYKVMIDKCHEKGIKIYAGTIMPVGGHEYCSDLHEQIRTAVNEWIRSDESKFDGVIDFADIMADPNDPPAPQFGIQS